MKASFKRRPQWGQDLYLNALILTDKPNREVEVTPEPKKPWVEAIRVNERVVRRPGKKEEVKNSEQATNEDNERMREDNVGVLSERSTYAKG